MAYTLLIEPTSMPSKTAYARISGTLIVFLNAIAMPRTSVGAMPPSISGSPKLGVSCQAMTATTTTMANSPVVFMTTSSMVRRRICAGPAVGRL